MDRLLVSAKGLCLACAYLDRSAVATSLTYRRQQCIQESEMAPLHAIHTLPDTATHASTVMILAHNSMGCKALYPYHHYNEIANKNYIFYSCIMVSTRLIYVEGCTSHQEQKVFDPFVECTNLCYRFIGSDYERILC